MKELIENGIEIIPQILEKTNEIKIPNKLHKVVDFIPENKLKDINKDIKVAKELCLYFLSFLTETLFDTHNDGKYLLSTNLAKYLRSSKSTTQDNVTYIKIIDALKNGTDNGPIIEVDNHFTIGVHSRKYNLTEKYKKGIQTYKLKTKYVKDIKYRNTLELLINANTNPIAVNLLRLYPLLDLPTKQELIEKGKELSKNNYCSKKGKKLTMRYRKEKSYWNDSECRSFVEDDIMMYEYYVLNGFMIPIVGNENCPRVFDSLSLLPSWIRQEIKIDGKPLIEADYSCLHPNLIMNIYKGDIKYITHQSISQQTGIDINKVKLQHLSLFNLKTVQLINSTLFEYYNNICPLVMKNIIKDKEDLGYKITSKLLFNLEVQLMENVIKKLNAKNIYVVYIYDALMTSDENLNEVVNTMNETALEMNIYTKCKVENTTPVEIKTKTNIDMKKEKETLLETPKFSEKKLEKIYNKMYKSIKDDYIVIDNNHYKTLTMHFIDKIKNNIDFQDKNKFISYYLKTLDDQIMLGKLVKR